MDLRDISQKLETEFSKLFEELRSGIAAREDSRAFGAMVEHRIKQHWGDICSRCGFVPVDLPGRRTIFDFGFKVEERIVGIDVKTKIRRNTRTLAEAEDLLDRLEHSNIESYLKSLGVEGTCNWAQPGRIKRFLQFVPETNQEALELPF